ncbi:MAG: hypothetical protein QM705_02370 [Ancrocorticia sp.]
MKRLLLALGLMLAFLTGCSTEPPVLDVTVNGELGAPVTMTVNSVPEELKVETLLEGHGSTIVADGTVLVRATSFDSRTGEIIAPTGSLRLTTANVKGLGDVGELVVGAREGSRLLIAQPGLVPGDNAAELVVVDILSTVADGTEVPRPAKSPAGMPKIEINDDGVPSVASGGGAVPDLAVVPLIEGDGAQVANDDDVVVQYLVGDSAGKVLDTTWTNKVPIVVKMSEVMDGLRIGLTDQKVGSRVLVLIPSAQASGTGDRFAIVDVLGIYDSTDEKATATPSVTSTPSSTKSPSATATPTSTTSKNSATPRITPTPK